MSINLVIHHITFILVHDIIIQMKEQRIIAPTYRPIVLVLTTVYVLLPDMSTGVVVVVSHVSTGVLFYM